MMSSKIKKRRSVYIDDSSWSTLESDAFRENVTVSEFLRRTIKRGGQN